MQDVINQNEIAQLISTFLDIEQSRLERWMSLLKKEGKNSKQIVLEEMSMVYEEFKKS